MSRRDEAGESEAPGRLRRRVGEAISGLGRWVGGATNDGDTGSALAAARLDLSESNARVVQLARGVGSHCVVLPLRGRLSALHSKRFV